MSQTNVDDKKKRGRKKQNMVIQVDSSLVVQSDILLTATASLNNVQSTTELVDENKPLPKKRGRKPKGGKIIQQTVVTNNSKDTEPNIILHLKCSLKDICDTFQESFKYDPHVESIQSFNFDNNTSVIFLDEDLSTANMNELVTPNSTLLTIESPKITKENKYFTDQNTDEEEGDIKTIWKKVNSLKVKLHNNEISDKRSACFWCTCEFDNPPIFIPKNEFKDTYQVYGCFCSPQCGTAYLMNEKIDSSIKFERYQLLNHVYGKIYNYDKNIKPAANPYYTLDKFYGNLSIKEYRELSKNDQLLIVVDKPLTHVFPELYEDNSDFILNQRSIPANNNLKLKRKTANTQKTSVIETLGINKI